MEIAGHKSRESAKTLPSMLSVLLIGEPDFEIGPLHDGINRLSLNFVHKVDVSILSEIDQRLPLVVLVAAEVTENLKVAERKCLRALAKKNNIQIFVLSTNVDSEFARKSTNIRQIEFIFGVRAIEIMLQKLQTIKQQSLQLTRLTETKENLEKAHHIAKLGCWTLYSESRRMHLSDSALKLLQPLIQTNEQTFSKFISIVQYQDQEVLTKAILKCISSGRKFSIDHRILFPNGQTRFFNTTGERDLRDGSSDKVVLATIQDITDRKVVEITNEHLALYDSLTDLPNRRLFDKKLRLAIKHSKDKEKLLAICFIDLDNFKSVNDNLGHAIGDELLKSVARRLRADLRQGDIVTRLAGDEFAIAIEDVNTVSEIELIVEKVRQSLAKPHTIRQRQVMATASIGITIYPMDSGNQQELLSNADAAMYTAKRNGGDRYCYYTYNMCNKIQRRQMLSDELKYALQSNQMSVYYQPQYDVRSEKIVGVEALLRWVHPEQGLLLPFKFLDIAEESGLILPLGRWLMRSACMQLRRWKRMGFGDIRLTINLSASELAEDDLCEFFQRTLQHYHISSKKIIVEVSEKTLLQNLEVSCELVETLKQTGVGLRLDNFGVGESSMEYLQRFQFDGLNIDRSFVMGIADRAGDGATAKVIIAMARNMGLTVKAEGVETHVQLDFLRKHGCDELQGFVFYPAVTAEKLTALFQSMDLAPVELSEIIN